jgi:hypothetical protein
LIEIAQSGELHKLKAASVAETMPSNSSTNEWHWRVWRLVALMWNERMAGLSFVCWIDKRGWLKVSSLLSCGTVVALGGDADGQCVLADENEVVHQAAVAAGHAVYLCAGHLKALKVFSLVVFHRGKAFMANAKTTGGKAASAASKTLQSQSTGKASKAAAGSALSQAKPKR